MSRNTKLCSLRSLSLRIITGALSGIMLSATFSPTAAVAQNYRVTDLGTLGGVVTSAIGAPFVVLMRSDQTRVGRSPVFVSCELAHSHGNGTACMCDSTTAQ